VLFCSRLGSRKYGLVASRKERENGEYRKKKKRQVVLHYSSFLCRLSSALSSGA
jgi:hypothetical protein